MSADMGEHGLSLADFVAHVGEFARVCGSAKLDDVREWGRIAVERAFGWAEYVQSTAEMLRDPREAALVDRWVVEQLAQAAGAEPGAPPPPVTPVLTVARLAGRDGDAGGATSLLLRTLLLNPDTPSEVARVALQHMLRPADSASQVPGSADPDEEAQEARVVTALLQAVRERARLRLVQVLLLDSAGGSAVAAQHEAAVAAAEHGARGEPANSSALVTARAVALALSDRASRAPLRAVDGFFRQPGLFAAQPKLLEAAAWLASGALREPRREPAAWLRADPTPLAPAQSAHGPLQLAALKALGRAVADAEAAGAGEAGGAAGGTAGGGVAAELFALHPQLLALVCAADAADSSPAQPPLLAAYLRWLRGQAVDLCGGATSSGSGETDGRRGDSGGGGGGIVNGRGEGLGARRRYVSSRPEPSSSVCLRASDWRGLAERWRWLWEAGCGGRMRPHLERELRRAEGDERARLLAAGLRGALRRRLVVTDELGALLASCAATGAGGDELIWEIDQADLVR